LQKEVEKIVAFALTVFDHVEVFMEMAAYDRGQNSYRWRVVVCIQVAKFVECPYCIFLAKFIHVSQLHAVF
jgi:Peroxisomal membrane protein (Pex16)